MSYTVYFEENWGNQINFVDDASNCKKTTTNTSSLNWLEQIITYLPNMQTSREARGNPDKPIQKAYLKWLTWIISQQWINWHGEKSIK